MPSKADQNSNIYCQEKKRTRLASTPPPSLSKPCRSSTSSYYFCRRGVPWQPQEYPHCFSICLGLEIGQELMGLVSFIYSWHPNRPCRPFCLGIFGHWAEVGYARAAWASRKVAARHRRVSVSRNPRPGPRGAGNPSAPWPAGTTNIRGGFGPNERRELLLKWCRQAVTSGRVSAGRRHCLRCACVARATLLPHYLRL